jgi:hypothetical protein
MADNSFRVSKNLSLNPQTSVPTNPVNGDAYYDANQGTFVVYDNGFWINLASQVDVPSASLLNSAQFTAIVVQNSLVRVTGSTVSGLYGMTASTGGKQIVIYNDSSAILTIYSETNDSAANQFLTPGGTPIVIAAGTCAIAVYDDAQDKWIIAAAPSAATSSNNTLWVAQEVPLISGITSTTIAFATPQVDTSYVVFAMMENLIDPTPMYQQVEVTGKTVNGFTVTWNVPLDTTNYVVSFIVPPRTNTYAEASVGSSVTDLTQTLVLPQASSIYPVIAQMQDLVDMYPQFQPLTVTTQTSANTVFEWNAPTLSSNYQVIYMLNGSTQVAIGSGVTSVTIPLPVSYGTTSYGIMVTMSNSIDSFPQFQPLLVTSKTASSVTVRLNSPTLSGNYILTAYAISATPT